ncbi:hypothetical protein MYA83_12440 [Pseudomonas palleroniana]|uniref:hypothetical protein n=1 Tax=Pseudomonas palleroniana TaxID=191390 RepID=UPI003B00100C
MQAVIYAGLRNGERDQRIHDALVYKHVVEVAKEFQLAPSTIRAAAKRIQNAVVFELCLIGGGAANAYWQRCRGLFQESGARRIPQLPRHLPKP